MSNKNDNINSGSFMGGYINKICLDKDFMIFKRHPDGYYSFYEFGIDASDLKINVNPDDLEKLKKRINNCMVELIEILNEEIWDRIKSENKKKESENSDKNIGFGFFDLIDKDGI